MADEGRDDPPVDAGDGSSEEDGGSGTKTKTVPPPTGALVAEITQQVITALQKPDGGRRTRKGE